MSCDKKGVYNKTKKLKDGTELTYSYHRASGARIEGEPGSMAFENALAQVRENQRKPEPAERSFAHLVELLPVPWTADVAAQTHLSGGMNSDRQHRHDTIDESRGRHARR